LFVDFLIGWLFVRLIQIGLLVASWLVGWLAGWFVGWWLVDGWFVRWSVGFFYVWLFLSETIFSKLFWIHY